MRSKIVEVGHIERTSLPGHWLGYNGNSGENGWMVSNWVFSGGNSYYLNTGSKEIRENLTYFGGYSIEELKKIRDADRHRERDKYRGE